MLKIFYQDKNEFVYLRLQNFPKALFKIPIYVTRMANFSTDYVVRLLPPVFAFLFACIRQCTRKNEKITNCKTKNFAKRDYSRDKRDNMVILCIAWYYVMQAYILCVRHIVDPFWKKKLHANSQNGQYRFMFSFLNHFKTKFETKHTFFELDFNYFVLCIICKNLNNFEQHFNK